jgi:hypothetical protein
MTPLPRRMPRVAFLAAAATLVTLPLADASAQSCTPAACGTAFHGVDFESLAPGTSVEGPGAVDPALTITSLAWTLGPSCPAGSARVIEETNPLPYNAYDAGAAVTNGCLGGIRGFGDDAGCVLDYDFTFAPGLEASCFGLKIYDYGDYFPFGGTTHQVTLSAYDAANALVDQDVLSMLGGVDLANGDACTTQPGTFGNQLLAVSGPGIVRVELRFDAWPDPNIGFDEIRFCAYESPTHSQTASWGAMKDMYREGRAP